MPYLTCPHCHISVFRAPLDARQATCPRCGTATSVDLRFDRGSRSARTLREAPVAADDDQRLTAA